MANSIIMPKTGMAMEEGIIVEWLVKEGDTVSKGDIVALIETDKSTMELESDYNGVILAVLHKAGETVPVTKVIAWIGQSGEAVPAESGQVPNDVRPAVAAENPAVENSTVTTEKFPEEKSSGGQTGKVKATPAARTLAKEQGIDLQTIVPGGRHGEIKKNDIQSIFNGKPNPASLHSRKDTRVALTNIQKITGKRLSESRQTIPEVTVHIKADVTRMLDLRQELNGAMAASDIPGKISINDFVLAATVKALLAHPRLNSVLDGNELIYKGSVNLGMAVAAERGLVVPVIHNAEDYSLIGLSSRAAELAVSARAGTLKSEEMSGGTFTVSNIGMYGVTAFTPIINPPEAAILGVCAVEDELALEGEKVTVRKKLGLSLAFDHRIVDGAESAIFLSTLRKTLEAPLLVLI